MKISLKHYHLVILAILSLVSIGLWKLQNATSIYSEEIPTIDFISHFGDSANDVLVIDNRAYVASIDRVEVYNLSDPLAITKEGEYLSEGCSFEALAIEENYAYVTETDRDCDGQLYVLDISNPESIVNVLTNPITQANAAGVEIKVKNRIAYIALAQDGLGVVDFSDMTNPVVHPKYDEHAGTFRDIDIEDKIVYLANTTGGFLIIDVSDTSDIKTLEKVDFPSGQFADYHTYGIKVDTGMVYVSGGERLMKIFNAVNVLNIVQEYSSVKEGSLSYDVDKEGEELFLLRRNDGLYVFDVLSASEPKQITYFPVSVLASKLTVADNYLYVSDPTRGVDVYKYNSIDVGPPPISPFLDLPWDYRSQGFEFTEAAYAINSFFDHQYPLLSTSLDESDVTNNNLIGFDGNFLKKDTREYSSHDGYDWGSVAGVKFGTPQLAAADGIATFVDSCGACGNAIYIDHGNGYQTRHYHLQDTGLIVNDPNLHVPVQQGKQIGLTGFTGNIRPNNQSGSHIHFMVVHDKNGDGSFGDNIPDGLVDPFGWQSTEPDPWENYTFTYRDILQTGAKSSYLWKYSVDNRDLYFDSNGGVEQMGHFKVSFPVNSYSRSFRVNLSSSPVVITSNSQNSIGPSLIFTSSTESGEEILEFNKNFTLFIDFEKYDLSAYDLSTLAIYSSQDGVNWVEEETEINFDTHIASVQVNHLTHFALMAERIDSQPPVTAIEITGQETSKGHYRSEIAVVFSTTDDSDIAYTAYSVNDQKFAEYKDPIIITDEGDYEVAFYSEDIQGNIEQVQTVTVSIDKTIPEANIYYDTSVGNIVVTSPDEAVTIDFTDLKKEQLILLTDDAGNKLSIIGKHTFSGNHQYLTIKKLVYNDIVYQVDLNKFAVTKGNTKSIFQSWLTKDFQIRLSYPYRNDFTRVHRTTAERQYSTIEEGLKILHLVTNKGLLEHNYE